MGREPLGHPGDVVGVGDAVELHDLGVGEEDELDAVDDPTVGPDRFDDGARDVDEGLVVHRVGGVEVHEAADAVGGPVGHAGDDHPAVAVADQDHVAKILVVQQRRDVGDVGVEVDAGAHQM